MNLQSPSLAELQHAFSRSLFPSATAGDLGHENAEATAWVLADGLAPSARLNVYRNTATSVLATALCLAFPAVKRLVGADFLEGAARLFSEQELPATAWLDAYGAAFPAFLETLPQAASVPYLADVARLEWQVNVVLHASDVDPLDLSMLAGLTEDELGSVRLAAHPSARLQRCTFVSDAIWRAVLDEDDAALAAISLDEGPVRLLVQRTGAGVDLLRLSDGEWLISEALFAGEPLSVALARAPDTDGYALFAAYLARGCLLRTPL